MLIMIEQPEQWESRAQTQQFYALKHFSTAKPEKIELKRNDLVKMPIENWGFIRIVNGSIGLMIDGMRTLALEPGDCWLGYPGGLYHWYQEGAVELEVWSWQGVSANVIPTIILGFSDLMLDLIKHNNRISPDPMPGFEFFSSGDVFIKEGEVADSVFTLIQGRAKVLVGGKQVGVAKENELIGLQAMLLKTTRTATVVADGACSAVVVKYDKFRTLIETRPELVISTLETMARQIERGNIRLMEKE